MPHSSTHSYYRLITLWVVCEAFIGGIIHGLHIPVSGLIVGSAAATCIALIGWYHPSAGSILRATLVVLIFKMILSPQSPITAYVAVVFQGLLGEIMFRNKKYFKPAAISFAVITLLESAFQRFLILTIVYGSDIWSAINIMVNKFTGQQQWTNYSNWFIGIYTALHLLAGLLVGYGISILPERIEKWRKDPQVNQQLPEIKLETSYRSVKKWGIWFIWAAMLVLLIQSYWGPGEPVLPSDTLIHMIARSVVIVGAWIIIAGPLMKKIVYQWLKNKQGKLRTETEAVLGLLPEIHQLVNAGITVASKGKGWKKYGMGIRHILLNALYEEAWGSIYILSAPKGSGKTSSLMQWSSERNDVYGILSPVVEGKRMFLDMQSREAFPMEAVEGEAAVFKVGKYIFSRNAFDRAIDILDRARLKKGWLVIDEIGPLELRGEGLNEVVLRCIQRKGNTIIVTREGLEEQVITFLQASVNIIHSVDELPA